MYELVPVAICMALASSPVVAQSSTETADEAIQLQDVVVTAERVESVVRKTPVSIGVLQSREIEAKAITQLSDLVGQIAGVTVPNGFSNMPQAVGIRGVGVSQPASSQAVGIYIDDVPLVRGYATALWDLPDILRIEVLRGPQGTLYGQNSSAGAVKVISAPPSRAGAAWISAGIGTFGAREARGYVSTGLGDGPLSGSFAFSRRENDGFGYNATRNERVNKLDATQFRGKLRLALPPAWDAVLAIDGLIDRSDTNTVNYPLNAPNPRPRVTYTSGPDGAFRRNAGGASLHLTHRRSDTLTLRSITAHRAYRDDPTVADFGGLPVQRFGIDQTVEQQTFSQEFQAQGTSGGAKWTAGAMLVADRFDFDRFSVAFPLSASAPSYSEALTHLSTVDVGLYGQGRLALSEATGVTAGLRVYRTRQQGENSNWLSNAAQQRLGNIYSAPDLQTQSTGWLPRLGVDHELNPDVFLYASVGKGEKFGGFNRAATSPISASFAARPEKVTAYEMGSKGRFASGRLTANLAVFYNDYRDYLAALSNLTIGGVLVPDAVFANAGKAKTYGIDVDLAARLSPGTEWNLSLEWLRSRFVTFANPTGAPARNYVGNELPYAPRLSLGLGVRQQWLLAGGQSLLLDAALRYSRQRYTDPANTKALQTPSEIYVDAGASYSPSDAQWTFSLRVRNVLNKAYVLIPNVIAPLGVDAAYYNPPRTVLFTARHDF